MLTYNDGFGSDTTYAHDPLDHLTSSTDGENNKTRFKYDGEGLLVERIEPKGSANGNTFKTSYQYNALRSLTQVTDAAGRVWSYEYDDDQNLTKVTDPLTRATNYEYDSLHRLEKVTQPQNLITSYDYDENGNTTLVTDPLGQQTQAVYDELDRPQTVNYMLPNNILPIN